MKEPRRQVFLQYAGIFLPPPPSPTPMQHNVGPPTQYRFNVRPVTQPIAGSMPVNRIRHWPSIETELGECPVFALTAIRVTLYPTKGHYADDTIH